MPDTASTTAASARGKADQAASRSRSRRAADAMPLQTLAQYIGARDYEPRGAVDDERATRSFHLPVGLIERAKATSTGVQHKAYDTDIGEIVPNSFSAFVGEAIAAACTYYENLLNGGKEFTRIGRLSPGPTREGAQRGANKRAAIRAAAAGDTQS